MIFEKLDPSLSRAKDVLVLIPALHLFCCFVYLFSYYYSFGHGLIYLASPTEVFSVSLSEIAPLYIFGGIGAILGIYMYETDDQIDERYSEKGARFAKFTKESTHWIITIGASLIGIVALWASIVGPYVFWFHLMLPLTLGGAWILGYLGATNGMSRLSLMPVMLALISVVLIGLNGLSNGQDAAKMRFDVANLDGVRCGDVSIVKDVSDRFLAIDGENNRVIIDQDCEVVFHVISGRKIVTEPPLNPFKTLVTHYSS